MKVVSIKINDNEVNIGSVIEVSTVDYFYPTLVFEDKFGEETLYTPSFLPSEINQ